MIFSPKHTGEFERIPGKSGFGLTDTMNGDEARERHPFSSSVNVYVPCKIPLAGPAKKAGVFRVSWPAAGVVHKYFDSGEDNSTLLDSNTESPAQ